MFLLDIPIVRAIILGIIQGLTEFLPVSSSGHLVAVPYLLSWPAPGIGFNVALHAGTLIAVVAYFARDIGYLATRSLGVRSVDAAETARARRTVLLLVIGTVPAAVIGLAFGGFFEEMFSEPLPVAGFWLVTAALLATAELVRRRRARVALGSDGTDERALASADVGRDETTVTVRDVIAIGLAQAAALFPGISRSGSTIAMGMYLGLSRAASARFSFLLAIPIIAGATAAELPAVLREGVEGVFSTADVVAGMVAAAVAGYWAIRFLLRLVETDDLFGFVRYLVLVAGLLGVGWLWLGPPSEI